MLQNITDQFAPLMENFRIFFFWEQERTDLKYAKVYIVDALRAAPTIDNTERCGIAADHRGMCKFETNTSRGFRPVMSALRKYTQEAPQVIKCRCMETAKMLNENQRQEALEMLRGVQPLPADEFPPRIISMIRDS
jgi:hypothetical protein